MSDLTPAQELRAAADYLDAQRADTTPGPWFVADCEGHLQMWHEPALRHVRRDDDGALRGYSLPGSYTSTHQIAEHHDLETWDEGEDPADDERRATFRYIEAMHPPTGEHLAAALRAAADEYDQVDRINTRNPGRDATRTMAHPLTISLLDVARSVNGRNHDGVPEATDD